MEDLLTEPAPLTPGARAKESSDQRTASQDSAARLGRLEMRDLFRSGSAAQFLLHGNVFDVVPGNGRCCRCRSFSTR